MELGVNSEVKVSGKVLTKDNEVVDLSEEPAVIKKLDGDYAYVQTQYGTHYIALSQLNK